MKVTFLGKIALLIVMAALAVSFLPQGNTQAQDRRVLNLYSARHYGAIELPFTEFEAATGIEIRLSQGTPQALLERLRAEGDRTPADVLLVIDAGVLSLAADEGLLQAVESEVLLANIDPSQRDPQNRWFGLSQRLRTVVYNPANVTEDELAALNTYADLANPEWEGRLCLRPASHIYTISLTSSLIHNLGEDEARRVVEGWVKNTTAYIDSDTSLISAVAAGECDVTLVNHYYLGRLVSTNDPVAEQVALKWMNQDTTGVFYNVNGAGITANAENYDEALEFLEYMSSLEAQAGGPEGFPGSNFEYPTNFGARPNETIEAFGERLLDLEYPLWDYGALQAPAITLLEEAGYGFSAN
jgi:iron(III) transport system substrate-binding protein